jgi:hypothetical protein
MLSRPVRRSKLIHVSTVQLHASIANVWFINHKLGSRTARVRVQTSSQVRTKPRFGCVPTRSD